MSAAYDQLCGSTAGPDTWRRISETNVFMLMRVSVWLCMWGTVLLHTCWESEIGTWTTSWSHRTYSIYLCFHSEGLSFQPWSMLCEQKMLQSGSCFWITTYHTRVWFVRLMQTGWTLLSHRFRFCPWWWSKAWSAIGASSILNAEQSWTKLPFSNQKPAKEYKRIKRLHTVNYCDMFCTQLYTIYSVLFPCRTCLGCSFDAWESSAQVEGTVNYSKYLQVWALVE